MSLNLTQRITSTLLSIAALSVVIAPACFAEQYFDQGIKLFSKKQYSAAKPYFDKAAENAPWDSNAFYYQALDAQYLRDYRTAKVLWGNIIERFPGTPAANNATAVMKQLDPGYFSRAKTASKTDEPKSGTPRAGVAARAGDDVEAMISKSVFTAPAQSRIPITRSDNKVMLDAQINNRSIKLEFNGSSTSLTPKDAATLGITNPDRTAVKVGTHIPVAVRLNDIVASNFPVGIEDIDRSRIGDDFFRKFSYTLEPSVLLVTKKLGASSTRTSCDLPFRKQGTDMIVDVTMNGRRCSMIFDANAGEVVVPKKRAREFGLEIQEETAMEKYDVEKQAGPLRGEAGFGDMKTKTVAEAKINIGPVSNQIVQVKVDENAKDAKVGSSAFSGWKFSIDPGASLIRFSR